MKTNFILLTILLIPTLLFSQKEFKNGYIINNNFQRIDGLIANYGSENSSESYVFKEFKKDSIIYLSLNNVREFGVENSKRFVLANILIEVSDSKVEDKADSTEYTLKWDKKNTFIEVLLKGDLATLYYYNYKGIDNYYLQIKKGRLIPLIYKRYLVKTNNQSTSEFIENKAYKDVLKNTLKCKDGNNPARYVNYSKKSLIEYLKKYYECNNSKYTIFHTSKSATRFNFKAAYLVNYTNFGVNDGTASARYIDFANKTIHSFGLEVEYMIPFNQYQLSIFLESNYQYFSGTHINEFDNNKITTVNYKDIEIPIGLNYYVVFNSNSRLFFRAAVIPNIVLDDSSITFGNRHEKLDSPVNAYIGIGFSYKRVSIDYRYYTTQNLTVSIPETANDSDFDHMSIRVAFTFAKLK